jgi:uncharacterized phage-associated protein
VAVSSLEFRFDFERALQAAGVLLSYERARRMNFMRLLKLLYVADRESLAETGRPITGDRAVALKRGPVLGRVYDLIKGQSPRAGEWGRFILTDRYEVELVGEPGRGKLSRQDVARLRAVYDRYRDLDEWALSEETHNFPEWRQHFPGGDGCADIPWEDALAAAGRADLAEDAARDERARRLFDRVFGG